MSFSCLKAGLKTWKDHLERIAALEAERLAETEAAEAELEAVARSAAESEEDVATHNQMRSQLELCQVGTNYRAGLKSWPQVARKDKAS